MSICNQHIYLSYTNEKQFSSSVNDTIILWIMASTYECQLEIVDWWSTRIAPALTIKSWTMHVTFDLSTWRCYTTYHLLMGAFCALHEYNPWNRQWATEWTPHAGRWTDGLWTPHEDRWTDGWKGGVEQIKNTSLCEGYNDKVVNIND